jgi:hypothetical protein
VSREKIGNYKKLDRVIETVISQQKEPVTANKIEDTILKEYQVKQIKVNPRSIGQRLKGRPNVRVDRRGKQNFYSLR